MPLQPVEFSKFSAFAKNEDKLQHMYDLVSVYLDLLHESTYLEVQLSIEQSTQQIEPQAKPPPPIAIRTLYDPKHLQPPNLMLNSNSHPGQGSISLFVIPKDSSSPASDQYSR